MEVLSVGVIGCGYFARNHLHAWQEMEGVRIVGVCDLDAARREECARLFNVKRAWASAEEMLAAEELDFVDVVTQHPTHRPLVELAARRGLPVICQKPMALSMEDARAMVEACSRAGVPFMVHENFRWQRPMRVARACVQQLGKLFFGRVTWRTGFDVFRSQPYLAQEERFALCDIGVHTLDLARFLMGEAASIYCLIQRVNPAIRGEDVATVLLQLRDGGQCVVEQSFASRFAVDPFPETLATVEGERGTVTVERGFRVRLEGPAANETADLALPAGTPPPARDRGGSLVFDADISPPVWAQRPFHVIQESVAAIQRHWLECLRVGRQPETSGIDNLRTLALVFAAYESAGSGRAVRIRDV